MGLIEEISHFANYINEEPHLPSCSASLVFLLSSPIFIDLHFHSFLCSLTKPIIIRGEETRAQQEKVNKLKEEIDELKVEHRKKKAIAEAVVPLTPEVTGTAFFVALCSVIIVFSFLCFFYFHLFSLIYLVSLPLTFSISKLITLIVTSCCLRSPSVDSISSLPTSQYFRDI